MQRRCEISKLDCKLGEPRSAGALTGRPHRDRVLSHSGRRFLIFRGKAGTATTQYIKGHFLGAIEDQQPGQPETVVRSEEDAGLAAAVLRRDRKATGEFVERHADRIYAYVRSRLAPRYDLVDDLVQEVFLVAWEKLDQYRGSGPLQAWIMGIARHKVEDHYRARLRAPETIENMDGDSDVLASFPDFDRLLEQEQVRHNTLRVLSELSEQNRVVLIWRYWDSASAREMALKTGKTEKAIERLLARARAEFRQRWHRG